MVEVSQGYAFDTFHELRNDIVEAESLVLERSGNDAMWRVQKRGGDLGAGYDGFAETRAQGIVTLKGKNQTETAPSVTHPKDTCSNDVLFHPPVLDALFVYHLMPDSCFEYVQEVSSSLFNSSLV